MDKRRFLGIVSLGICETIMLPLFVFCLFKELFVDVWLKLFDTPLSNLLWISILTLLGSLSLLLNILGTKLLMKSNKVVHIVIPEVFRQDGENGYRLYEETCKKSIDEIDRMDGIAFERYCAGRLRANGWKVTETKASHDFGIDLIAVKDSSQIWGIQCKRYSSNVGVKAVQEVLAGAISYRCTGAAVLTNQIFTKDARMLATKTGVLLLDREYLRSL